MTSIPCLENLGKGYPMMWYPIPECKNPQEFPVVIRDSNDKKNAHKADGY